MRQIILAIVCVLIAIPSFAKDKKEWQAGKILEVKIQDMQNSDYSNPNSVTGQGRAPVAPGDASRGPAGGGFTSAPTHFVIYNMAFETEEEIIMAKLTREATYRPPDLKAGGDIKWRPAGPKFVEVQDSSGKKFEFQVVKREKKTPKQ